MHISAVAFSDHVADVSLTISLTNQVDYVTSNAIASLVIPFISSLEFVHL